MTIKDIESYLDRASIIPISRDKKPLIPWKEYQSRKATKEEVENWLKKFPNMNIGIVTGKISNIAVVDVEKGGNTKDLPETLKVKTGGDGYHFYYQYTEGIENKARIRELTDIRGEGGYVVCPPSIHASGKKYEWLNKTNPVLFPRFLFGLKKEEKWDLLANGVGEGERNETAAKYIGKLMNVFSPDTWENTVWETTKIWNSKNQPSLPEGELRNVYQSIKNRALKNERKIEIQKNVEFLSFTDILKSGKEELLNVKPSDIVSFGYDWLDEQLTGLFPGELVIIGGETGTGKTTFATNIIYKASKENRCCIFALEDRLNDYAIKALYFVLGKIRKEKGENNYLWNCYRKNEIGSQEFLADIAEAENRLKNENIYFAKVEKQINIDLLEKLVEQQVEQGTTLFLIDHLHYFDLFKKEQSKADYIEQVMVRIKTLQNRTGARIIMIVHYKKLDGRKPRLDSFKDSISIVQNANYVINLWREREKETDPKYQTTFFIPKTRNPNGEGMIKVEFDPQINDYKNIYDQSWKRGIDNGGRIKV